MVWEHWGAAEQGVRGESRREGSTKGGGLERIETFASCSMGGTGVCPIKTLWGSFA